MIALHLIHIELSRFIILKNRNHITGRPTRIRVICYTKFSIDIRYFRVADAMLEEAHVFGRSQTK